MDILSTSWSAHLLFLLICIVSQCGADYQLTVLHTNDVHSRVEQFNKYGSECDPDEARDGECFGGAARRGTKVREIRESVPNVLLLDGGDQYQGTMWFFIYKGAAASHFMNMIGYDAMAIGNHEFDNEPEGLRPFLLNTTFPVLSCNIDASAEPSINGLFQKSVIRELSGERIGLIGYTYFKTHEISSSGECIFYPEIERIQIEVDAFRQAGINKIIAVGHSGIKTDLEIARMVEGVDVVIGGHTDTFLYTGDPPSSEIPYGDYPQVVNDQQGGGRALVVQDYTFGKYLGRLNITFNDEGEVIAYEGNPILMDSSIEQDQAILDEIEEWAGVVRNSSVMFVGISHAFLEGERTMCRARECNLGNLVSDAMVSQNNKNPDELRWNDVGIALMNAGSIRASISQGDITIGDIANVLPFGNTVDVLELRGIHLLEALENAVIMFDLDTLDGRFLQVAGLRVTYSLAREPGSRVVSAEAICTNCTVPHYEPLDVERVYKIVTNSFLAGGGDGYTVVRDNKMNHVTGNLDSAVFAEYIQRLTPVAPALEGRVIVLEEDVIDCTGLASRFTPSNVIVWTSLLAIISNRLSTL
ncbi:5'-nucleotidase [Strongylocentrotus purpuratus]|uniref:5'-nucleotidase n=1 Tax=Strongylocentrotus purpuratus TaxID=7668 RepID=A0A7M7PMX8_STRPU|nr:5'-nucleotidase [Strongylocentrotus purpuratus]